MQNRRTLFSFIFSIVLHLCLFAILLYGFHAVKNVAKKEKIISLKSIKIKQPKKIKKRVVRKKKIKKLRKIIKPKKPPKPKPKKIIKPKPKKIVKKIIHKIKHKKKPKKIITKKQLSKKLPAKQVYKTLPKITKQKDVNISKQTISPKVVFQEKPIIKEVVTPKVDIKQKFINLNTDKITKAINEEKYYPRIARKRHIEGIVKVSFLLKKDGSVIIKKIKTDKKYLGSAAKKTIKKAAPYFPKPPKDILFHVPIEFKLD